MKEKVQVLFVCLGNICRSPMAEGLFRHHVAAAGLADRIETDSAGTSDYHVGHPPDKRMRATAARHGIELDHAARQLQATDFHRFDYVIVMDEANYENARRLVPPNTRAQLRRMREFDPTPGGGQVPDPYFGGDEGFEEVYQMLDRSCVRLLSHLQTEYELP